MSERRWLLIAAEAALAALTLAALASVSRLLEGDWHAALVASAALAHLVAAILRRRSLPVLPAAALTALAAAVVITWTQYAGTTSFGLPTAQTWAVLQADLAAARDAYPHARVPAPALAGFVVGASAALWFIAFVADWAAFRLKVAFEAVLPAATLFLFAALVGGPRHQLLLTTLFAAAALAFLLLHRMERELAAAQWAAGGRRRDGRRWTLALGAALAGVAVLGGGMLGPRLPGAASTPLLDYRVDLDRVGTRVTVSPLVDIRSRLVERSRVELFTVRADQASYWRLTSLDDFDGRIWRSRGSFGSAGAALPSTTDQAPAHVEVRQSFNIRALAMLWLPAAFEPRTLAIEGASVRYDEDSATLIVDRTLPNSDGLSYTVVSRLPLFDPATLNAATGEPPEEVAARYLGLPHTFPSSVRALAQELVTRAGADTPYGQALALQSHLRGFTYDLDVPPGHSERALEEFLFVTQRGYCEQFAGAFAAMARSIGLPARVAVGFTPGEQNPDDRQVWHVRGEHAHAWPEVYLSGVGWVPFEPTPGRGAPFAGAWTGVAEQQAGDPPRNEPAGGDALPFPDAEPLPGAPDAPVVPPPGPILGIEDLPMLPEGAPAPGQGPWRQGLGAAWLAVTAVALAAGAYLVAAPLCLAAWRFARRRRARGAPARVQLAWTESVERAALVGFSAGPGETLAEQARRLANSVPAAADQCLALARRLEEVAYGPRTAPDQAADQAADEAEVAAAAIGRAARARTSLARRALRWLDPRPVVGRIAPPGAPTRRCGGGTGRERRRTRP